MKGVLTVLLALVFTQAAIGGSDAQLPYGGPFVNEGSFPEDGDPAEYFWVELALVDGDGTVTLRSREPGEFTTVSFAAMKGDVNRVLLYRGKEKWGRHYTVYSKQAVRILYVSHGGFVNASRDNPIYSQSYRPVAYRQDAEAVLKSNLNLIRKEVPVPSFSWIDPDLDIAKSEANLRKLRDERRARDDAKRREEYRQQCEREREEWKTKSRQSREREQLERVEKYKAEFVEGKADSGRLVSCYYAAYSRKLSANDRNVEAARAAAEAFKWLRESAKAGSPRAQESLAWHLLDGSCGGGHGGPFFWSGPPPDVPKDNAYVSPAAFQGADVPADVLLSETNAVKTFYRVYSRDPVEGVRMMKLAADAGDPWARSWIGDHEANKCDLSMPRWFLAKDGFAVAGKEAVSFEEVVIRPGLASAVKRKIGKDAEGRVVSVSDEYFEHPQYAQHYKNPWHEAGANCVITEALP